jgi:hypothetical protein
MKKLEKIKNFENKDACELNNIFGGANGLVETTTTWTSSTDNGKDTTTSSSTCVCDPCPAPPSR